MSEPRRDQVMQLAEDMAVRGWTVVLVLSPRGAACRAHRAAAPGEPLNYTHSVDELGCEWPDCITRANIEARKLEEWQRQQQEARNA